MARERDKSSLERDAAMGVQNQLLAQMEVFRRAWVRGSDEEDSRAHPSRSRARNIDCIGGS